MQMISFTVPGRPVPQPRPSVTGNGRVYYKANGCTEWRQAIALQAKRFFPQPLHAPMKLKAFFVFKRPPSHYTSTGKLTKSAKDPACVPPGDYDNYAKALGDALEGVAITNDKLFVCAEIHKLYGDVDRTELVLSVMR